MKRLIVLNPTARRAGWGRRLAEEMADAPGAELRTTSGPGEAADLARRGRNEGAEQVIAAGGDGTLHEVVNGLLRGPSPDGPDAGGDGGRRAGPDDLPAVGLLPLGTGNDVARSLGVPLDLQGARDVIESGAERTVDLGRVSGQRERYVVNSAIGGVGGLVERRLSDRMKRWLGPYCYRVAAILALRRVPRHRVTVQWAGGEESLRTVVYSVIVANGAVAGGGIPIAPGARMDDGRLELLLIEAGRRHRLPGLAWSVLRGRHTGRSDVRRVAVQSVTIRSRPSMWASVDGEVLGDEPLRVEVVPDALRALAPRRVEATDGAA